MRYGDEEEGLCNAQATSGNDTLEQAPVAALLDDVAERLEEALGRQALSSGGLCLYAHHLEGLIPGGESASDSAAQRFLPQGQLNVFNRLVRTHFALLYPTASSISESLSRCPVGA